jgi:hypothetical protein
LPARSRSESGGGPPGNSRSPYGPPLPQGGGETNGRPGPGASCGLDRIRLIAISMRGHSGDGVPPSILEPGLTGRRKRALIRSMIRFSVLLLLALALVGCAGPEGPANKLEKANVLPLALDDNFQFRKIQQDMVDNTKPAALTVSEYAVFERQRATWGAIDGGEIANRNGNYFRFFWKAREVADVTIRLEYRQAGLSNYVLAQERYYPGARGSKKSSFEVTGDEFLENGRVTSWRVLLIVDGRIVAMRQSFMWR